MADNISGTSRVPLPVTVRGLNLYVLIFILVWTISTIIAFWTSYSFIRSSMEMVAQTQMESYLSREERQLANYELLGGAYVLRSKIRAAFPAFDQQDARMEGRDGKIYTLLDAEQMMHFLHATGSISMDEQNFRLVSTDPRTLLYKPDNWETRAFASLSQDINQFSELTVVNGKQFLRVLRLLPAENADSAGQTAISITLPMEPLRDKVNNKIAVLVIIFIVLWAGGMAAGLLASLKLRHQIKERDQAQGALLELTRELEQNLNRRTQDVHKKQRELQTFIDNLDTGAYLKNNKFEFIAVNNRLAELLDLRKEDMLGRTDDWFTHTDTARQVRECEQLVATSRSSYEMDLYITAGDESSLHHIMFFPLLDEGMLEGIGAILIDLSERRRMELDLLKAKETAEKANQAKSDFLANVSHEIRTPLNGVIGMTDLLQRTQLSADQATMVATIKNSGDNLLEVLNEILDFSKIEAGKMQLDPMPFSLRDSLFEAIRSLAPAAYKKNLEVIVNIAPQVPDQLLGDAIRIRQVMLNLLNNAIKFTDNGEITLTVRLLEKLEDSVRLRFSLTDTGIGIPYEQQKRIFDAFEQVDSSTTRKYGGTGLGLAISSKLIKMMQGTLSLESTPGHGTTFWFELTLPCLSENAPGIGSVHNYDLHKYRVLLVDDNATNRQIAMEQLKEWKIQAHESASADEALRFLRLAADSNKPFDLLISDMQMPDKDGMGLAREIRNDPQLEELPIIILSSSNLTREQLAEKLVQIIINKPVRPDDFLRAIATALGLWESSDLSQIHKPSAVRQLYATRLKILLAEDVEVNQLVASRMLRNLGHSVTIANNGQEALGALGNQEFDLVLMDIRMPIMDGVEATAIIREREGLKNDGHHLPIVAMTAHALKGDKDKYMKSGMDAYVSKPLVQEDLVIVLNDIIERFALAGPREENDNIFTTSPPPAASVLPEPGAVAPAAQTVTEPTTADTLDTVLLEQNFGGIKELITETMQLYMRDAETYLQAMQNAINSADNKSLTLNAHSLKGMSAYYSKGAAYELSLELEILGREEKLPEKSAHASQCLQQLTEVVGRLKESMRQYIGAD